MYTNQKLLALSGMLTDVKFNIALFALGSVFFLIGIAMPVTSNIKSGEIYEVIFHGKRRYVTLFDYCLYSGLHCCGNNRSFLH